MAKNFMTKYAVNDIKTNYNIKKVMSEYSINCKKAQLKVLTESGTDDDLYYLYQESMNEAFSKLGDIIDDIIKKFLEFCKDVQINILSKMNSVDFKANVQKINDKLKFNPFLKNVKQTVVDYNPRMVFLLNADEKVKKMAAKLRSGNDISKELEDFTSWFDDKVDDTNATKKNTNAAIFQELKSTMEKVEGYIKDSREGCKKTLEAIRDIKPKNDEDVNPNLRAHMSKLCNYTSRINRLIIRIYVSRVTELLGICKREILNAKDEGSKETTNESAEDYFNSDYSLEYESVSDDYEILDDYDSYLQ